MGKTNNKAWKTEYGPRRVRNEVPTFGEAIVAAQGCPTTSTSKPTSPLR